ncbi:hypothetical protein HDE_03965 [Halotydeus destructor]|nr:hypothetical protein HDE_03965 [Halotydeus destructor]
MSYKWQVYPCGGKPTGQHMEQKDYQVEACGQEDTIEMPATNSKKFYYCKMSGVARDTAVARLSVPDQSSGSTWVVIFS